MAFSALIALAIPLADFPALDQGLLHKGVLAVSVFVAVATVVLHWLHFKKSHPVESVQRGESNADESAHRRWRRLFWREIRAYFFLALFSLVMTVLTLVVYRDVTLIALASLIFWLGMFFYNLWAAQWHAWRFIAKRRR